MGVTSLESPRLRPTQQQIGFGIRVVRPGDPLDHDTTVRLEQVEMAIVVEIDPAHAESGEPAAGRPQSKEGGDIGEVVPVVSEKGVRFPVEVADQQIEIPVPVDVACRHPHAGFGQAFLVGSTSAQQSVVFETSSRRPRDFSCV